MPAVRHSPPLKGFDQDLQPVLADEAEFRTPVRFDSPDVNPTSRARLLSRGSPYRQSRSLSRGKPVAKNSRPLRFRSSTRASLEREVSPNPVSEPSPISESSPVFRSAPNPKFAPLSNLAARLEPLPLGPVDDERLLGSPTKPDDSVLHLYCSPNTPPPGRNGRLGSRESRSTTSTQFDLPLLDDLDDDSQSSGTLVPDEVNRETEEFELSPAAKDIIQFIYDMEVDPQASSADRRKQKRILQIAVSNRNEGN